MNTAVSWCVPAANVEVVCEALPLRTITASPILALPSLNCTVPAAAAGVTVAFSVTAAPWTAGEAVDVLSAVVVGVTWRALAAGGAGLDNPPVDDVPSSSNAPPMARAATMTPDKSRAKALFFRTMRLFLFR